jgi:hypothetical protein
MLHKKTAVLGMVMAGAMFASLSAQAATVISNTGTANYENEWTVAQAAVTSTTEFLVASNPVLTVVKTHDKVGKQHSTDVVTYEIRVAYPKIADAALLCGDDSAAVNTVITDAIPGSMTKVNNSIQISTDNGTTWSVAGTDASDGVDASGYDVSIVAGTLTANLGTITECTDGASTIVIRFQATVN